MYLKGIKKKPMMIPKDLLAPPSAPKTSMIVNAFLVPFLFFSTNRKLKYWMIFELLPIYALEYKMEGSNVKYDSSFLVSMIPLRPSFSTTWF